MKMQGVTIVGEEYLREWGRKTLGRGEGKVAPCLCCVVLYVGEIYPYVHGTGGESAGANKILMGIVATEKRFDICSRGTGYAENTEAYYAEVFHESVLRINYGNGTLRSRRNVWCGILLTGNNGSISPNEIKKQEFIF